MAALNYSQGVPEQVPSLDAGTPHQSGRGADAEAFGGGLAQGGEALGQGMLTSAKFFGKVAADNASNDFQDFTSKLLHGDPSKNTTGPDGQPVYDTGYMGLKGRAALDKRPEIEKALNERIKEIRVDAANSRAAAGIRQFLAAISHRRRRKDRLARRCAGDVMVHVGQYCDGEAGGGPYRQQFRQRDGLSARA
jgi:hypothetical protein